MAARFFAAFGITMVMERPRRGMLVGMGERGLNSHPRLHGSRLFAGSVRQGGAKATRFLDSASLRSE